MNTSTKQYQKKPDYFSSPEECLKSEKIKIGTNPRYKFFTQTHFTAGDTNQFEEFRDATNGKLDTYTPNHSLLPPIFWEKYKDITASGVDNTFKYLFHKFKKGIFIKIKNGQLGVFLPFSKKNFVNEWGDRIHIPQGSFFKTIQELSGYKFYPNSVNKFPETWYCNNCLVRYEYPINEGDTNVPVTSDMFLTLCQERKIPDMEFFVNRRDFPLLKRDGTEPYEHMFDTEKQPLLSHNYEKYCPILSMVCSDNFADIAIPTGDDWARVTRKEGKYFSRTCSRSFEIENKTPWNQRKPIAVFRGSSTGAGITIDTNPRLKLAYMSYLNQKDTDGLPFLNAGITEWNTRPRKLSGEKYLRFLDPKSFPFSLVGKLPPKEQSTYKYIVNVPGHVCAFRLSLELHSGSCILLVTSKYKLWFQHLLTPFEHYIPVREDLSDLLEKIKWCKTNDASCERIAKNAEAFARKYLTKNGILDYLAQLLYEIKKLNGVYIYNEISPRQIVRCAEITFFQFEKNIKNIKITKHSRTWGFLRAVEMMVDKVALQFQDVQEIFNTKGTCIYKSKIGEYSVILKKNTNVVHEAFVGKKALNDLAMHIPNFAFIFGLYQDYMVMEHIPGQTLIEFIKSPEFSMKKYLFILIQLSLALYSAQNKCGFIHYDLMPWNIILKKLPAPIEIDYVIDYKTVYRLSTDFVPVIIDFGRTHVLYENQHYGTINIFSASSIHDTITLLTSTVYEVCEVAELTRELTTKLICLANFLSGTQYRPKVFTEVGRDGLGEIRTFFEKARKYDELLCCEKYELEDRNPFDFVKYIMANFKYDFGVEIRNNTTFKIQDNPRDIFYSMISEPIKKVKMRTLKTKDIFMAHYISKSLGMDYTGNATSMLDYPVTQPENVIIEPDIFQYPDKVLKIIQKPALPDIIAYKEIAEYVILTCNLNLKLSPNLQAVLSLNSFRYRMGIAHRETLRRMAKEIYTKNLEKIEKEKYQGLEEYKNLCKKIINLV